jgi:tRNA A-37 threonylcarbamoyl transferase component Bud32
MRFVFSPPAVEAAGLLSLPWQLPLEDWRDERLVEIRQPGLSRHVVRFVTDGCELYALKSISEDLARREYRMLRALADLGIPAVEVIGIVIDRGPDSDAVLVTRYLDFASTYRAVFCWPRGGPPMDRLLDALAELLVRLHLSGFFWGDCSLSNALFRADAGTLRAYLVDTETSERHPSLTDGQRDTDVYIAAERVCGELMDLQAGELLAEDVDPFEVTQDLERRYRRLWHELTKEEILTPEDQRYRMAGRLRCLNDLGFDADEVELIPTAEGTRQRIRTKVAELGHSSRQLLRQTGISAEEHQARRLLNDIASFRACREQAHGGAVSEMLAAHRWLEEVYDPVVAAIPDELRGRLAPPEIFHEILEHRWYMSEAAGRDVGTTAAAQSYFATVLPTAPHLPARPDDDALQSS